MECISFTRFFMAVSLILIYVIQKLVGLAHQASPTNLKPKLDDMFTGNMDVRHLSFEDQLQFIDSSDYGSIDRLTTSLNDLDTRNHSHQRNRNNNNNKNNNNNNNNNNEQHRQKQINNHHNQNRYSHVKQRQQDNKLDRSLNQEDNIAPLPVEYLSFSVFSFELNERQGCLGTGNYTVMRTFLAINTGQMVMRVRGFRIGSSSSTSTNDYGTTSTAAQHTSDQRNLCHGYGFTIYDCEPFDLKPGHAHEIRIAFTPDFTLTNTIVSLTIFTNVSEGLRYALMATVPRNLLVTCNHSLPRPEWETTMHYILAIGMVIMISCSIFIAYLEAKIYLKRERLGNHSTTTYTVSPSNNNHNGNENNQQSNSRGHDRSYCSTHGDIGDKDRSNGSGHGAAAISTSSSSTISSSSCNSASCTSGHTNHYQHGSKNQLNASKSANNPPSTNGNISSSTELRQRKGKKQQQPSTNGNQGSKSSNDFDAHSSSSEASSAANANIQADWTMFLRKKFQKRRDSSTSDKSFCSITYSQNGCSETNVGIDNQDSNSIDNSSQQGTSGGQVSKKSNNRKGSVINDKSLNNHSLNKTAGSTNDRRSKSDFSNGPIFQNLTNVIASPPPPLPSFDCEFDEFDFKKSKSAKKSTKKSNSLSASIAGNDDTSSNGSQLNSKPGKNNKSNNCQPQSQKAQNGARDGKSSSRSDRSANQSPYLQQSSGSDIIHKASESQQSQSPTSFSNFKSINTNNQASRSSRSYSNGYAPLGINVVQTQSDAMSTKGSKYWSNDMARFTGLVGTINNGSAVSPPSAIYGHTTVPTSCSSVLDNELDHLRATSSPWNSSLSAIEHVNDIPTSLGRVAIASTIAPLRPCYEAFSMANNDTIHGSTNGHGDVAQDEVEVPKLVSFASAFSVPSGLASSPNNSSGSTGSNAPTDQFNLFGPDSGPNWIGWVSRQKT